MTVSQSETSPYSYSVHMSSTYSGFAEQLGISPIVRRLIDELVLERPLLGIGPEIASHLGPTHCLGK